MFSSVFRRHLWRITIRASTRPATLKFVDPALVRFVLHPCQATAKNGA
jgi:hypothetical protein